MAEIGAQTVRVDPTIQVIRIRDPLGVVLVPLADLDDLIDALQHLQWVMKHGRK